MLFIDGLISVVKYIEKEFDEYLKTIDSRNIRSLLSTFEKCDHWSLNNCFNCKENERLILEAKQELLKYFISCFEEYDFPFSDLQEAISITDSSYDFLEDAEKEVDYIKYVLLTVAFVFHYYRNVIHNEEQCNVTSFDEIRRLKNTNYCFFRGQSNGKWGLVPSALRSINENVLYNNDYYQSRISRCGLDQKYINSIRIQQDEPLYYEYAFLQHACSYSPLIDFSKEESVAVSFALSNKNYFNEYYYSDSAVFLIGFNEEDDYIRIVRDITEISSFLSTEFKIYYVNSDTITFGKIVQFTNGSTIEFNSIPQMIDYLKPRTMIIDIPSNDRMKYQKGLFICFHNCLSLNGKICYELSNLRFIKLVLQPEVKDSFLSEISNNFRQFDSNHILDPYLIFKE